jgi:hypothetical protein
MLRTKNMNTPKVQMKNTRMEIVQIQPAKFTYVWFPNYVWRINKLHQTIQINNLKVISVL